MKLKNILYQVVGASVLFSMSATSALAVAGVTASGNTAGGASTMLKNAGGFAADIGSFTIGIAALIGLFLFMGGLIKINKHFKQQGGQQDSIMTPVIMIVVGLALMSLVLIKGAATQTMFGSNTSTKFDQTGANFNNGF